MTPTPHALGAKDLEREVARDAAQRIADAVFALPPFLRVHLALALASDGSTTLAAIGEGLLSSNPVAALADVLPAEVFIGDLEQVGPKLGDSEPWSTIRAALEDISAAWRAAHPGFRTAAEYRALRLQWDQETLERAAAAHSNTREGV